MLLTSQKYFVFLHGKTRTSESDLFESLKY